MLYTASYRGVTVFWESQVVDVKVAVEFIEQKSHIHATNFNIMPTGKGETFTGSGSIHKQGSEWRLSELRGNTLTPGTIYPFDYLVLTKEFLKLETMFINLMIQNLI